MAFDKRSATMRIDLLSKKKTSSMPVPDEAGAAPSLPARRLRKSKGEEPLYRKILQNLYDGALVTDLNGNIIDANTRALGFLLYEKEELCALSIFQVLSEADKNLLDIILENLEKERFTYIEGYCVRKDADLFPSEIVVSRLQEGDRDHLCFFVRDTTQRKLIEENLRISEAKNRELIERDLKAAGEIQRILLPSIFPDIQGLATSALYIPAHALGGDYYDIIPIDAHHWGFVIADVSGKGVAGAMIMAICRSVLRTTKITGNDSPAQVLKKLNQVISQDITEDMFISMIYGVLDVQTQTFTFCRAGHEPLLFYRSASKEHQLLSPQGMALGIDAGEIFDAFLVEAKINLQKGDILAFYTDGITEALNEAEEEFGRERLLQTIRENETLGAEKMVQTIKDQVCSFIGAHPQQDDMTLLLLRLL